MSDIFRSDISYLKDYFPLPCECIRTTGIGDGIILKFNTFYLKIYNSEKCPGHYDIEGYLYDNSVRVYLAIVPEVQMKSFASEFKVDDYMRSFNIQFQ